MNLEDFKTLLQKRDENNKYFEVSETLQSELAKVVDNTQVKFSKAAADAEYSDENTAQLDELQEQRSGEHFVIAVSSLYKSVGIDTIALEIAVMLAQAKQSVYLFLPDSLYYPYMDYHGIKKEAAQHGCVVNDLPIYQNLKSREYLCSSHILILPARKALTNATTGCSVDLFPKGKA